MKTPMSLSGIIDAEKAARSEGTFLLMSNKTGNHKFYHLSRGGVLPVPHPTCHQRMVVHYGKLGTRGVKKEYPADDYWKIYDNKRRKGYVDVSDVKRNEQFMCCNEAMLDLGSLKEWDSAKFKNGTHLVCWQCGTTSEHSALAALVLASLQEE